MKNEALTQKIVPKKQELPLRAEKGESLSLRRYQLQRKKKSQKRKRVTRKRNLSISQIKETEAPGNKEHGLGNEAINLS